MSHPAGSAVRAGAPEAPRWWSWTLAETVAALAVDPERGLDAAEVLRRRSRFGPNALPATRRPSAVAVFARQFQSPLIYLLLAAAAIAAGLREFLDASVILGVLLLNAVIGTLQEERAERAMDALRELTRLRVRVVREGREREVDAEELVPGDLVALAAGDAIGADARLVEAAGLETSESVLTGESLPVAKSIDPVDAGAEPAERASMVFAGTHATSGRGRALVVATGGETEFGRIAALTAGAAKVTTPLERRMARFGRVVLLLALAVCAAVVAVGYARGLEASQVWMVAISQLVSVVPEGLPVALTVGLAIGMQRMAARRAIVRQLAAVETLGSTTVICSDKTGTLTKSEMTATVVWLPDGRELEVTGTGYGIEGAFLDGGREIDARGDPALVRLLEAAALCNDARIEPPDASDPRWKAIGDPTEAALVALARKAELDPEALRAHHRRVGEIPFESTARWMATAHAFREGTRSLLKGAPEVILPLCPAAPDAAVRAADALAARALRVLAFAEAPVGLERGPDGLAGRARLLGLVGEIDPPREEARGAIATCEAAGIRVLMVTGDHRRTAAAIGAKLGLFAPGARVVEGAELEGMSAAELADASVEASVFARVQPVHKLRLVESLRARGEVVAMTGDGVNDAPALVRADVGVAMGLSGTEVARQASDVVVTDDDFSTIVRAVEEGRLVHRNLQKVVVLLLSTALAEVLVLLLAVLFGYPLPFAAVQILWNNVVTEGTITVNLTMDPREGDEMSRAPIPRDEPLLTRAMGRRMLSMSAAITALVLGWFAVGLALERPFAVVQTGTFVLLAACEWFNLVNCRSESRSAFGYRLSGNRWLAIGLALSIVLQAAVVYLPAANELFHTVPLAALEVLAIAAVASGVLWVEELRKLLARRATPRPAEAAA